MPDVKKKVVTRYELDAKRAVAQAKILQRRMNMVGKASRSVSSGIGRLGSTLARPLALASGAGLLGLTKGLIDVGREAQDAELQLTGLLQGVSKSSNLPLQGFQQARAVAADLRQEFIRLAADSPIAAKDVREAFEVGVFPLSRAGLSLKAQAEFARSISIADLSNVVKGTAAADVRQLFQGISNPRFIQTGLLKPIAKEVAKMAKSGDMAAAAKLIQEQLAPDPELLKAYGQSASGMLATLGDKLKQVAQTAAGPLLKMLVDKTREWGEWLENNKEKVKEIALGVGRALVKGIKAVIKAVSWLARNWKTVLTVVKTLVGVWILGKLISGISTAISFASKLGGVIGKIGTGRLAAGLGAVGAAVTLATQGKEIGEGLAKQFLSEREVAAIERFKGAKKISEKQTIAEFQAEQAKKSADVEKQRALEASLDPTKMKRRGGKKGRRTVKTLVAERLEVRDKRFARSSSHFVVGVRRESRAARQVVGLGLGTGAVGIGTGGGRG